MTTFLVEHYRPGLRADALTKLAADLREAVALVGPRSRLRYVRSTVVPHDEWFVSIFEAESEDLVREAYQRAGLEFERISPAITVDG
jgi:hypothetical protein